MRLHLLVPLVPFVLGALTAAPAAYAGGPSVGQCLSATETALKLRNTHKLRQARAQLLVCAAPTCPAEVRADCTHGIDEVSALAPMVVFTVKTGAGQELSDVKVTMDGEVIADHLDGSALTLDPGSHEFTFVTAGQPSVTQTFLLHEGDKGRRETIAIGPAALPLTTVPGAAAPSDARPEPHPERGHGSVWRTVGWATGAVGIVGLGVGTAFGIMALSDKSNAHCDATTKTCLAGPLSDANTAGTVSTVGLVAGGALVAGGIALLLLAPTRDASSASIRVAPVIGVRDGGLSLTGTW
jgi:hypothetical protein